MCRSYGIPYCLPSTCQPVAEGPRAEIVLASDWVTSSSLPDLIWVASWPPPHCWNSDGGLLPCSASGTLVVNCSFWIGTSLTVIFGLAAWKALATSCQTGRNGAVVPFSHQVRVTGPLELEPPPEPAPPLPPQAASVSAAA